MVRSLHVFQLKGFCVHERTVFHDLLLQSKEGRDTERKDMFIAFFLLLLLESKVKQTNPELISHLTSLSQRERERMLKCICNSSLCLYIQLWNDKCTLSPRFLMSENIFGIQHATQLIK